MVYFINNMNLQTILKLTKIPSWLWTLQVEDQAEAEQIHDDWLVWAGKMAKERYKDVSIMRKTIREWTSKPELSEFKKKARLRYLKKQLAKAVTEFQDNREQYILNQADELVLIAECLVKKINGYKREIKMVEGGEEVEGVITDEMLEAAREYPLADLLELGKNGRCRCVFHQGTDENATIKNNYYWCFVCSKSSDSIGVYMALHGVGFREAVSRLNNK